MRDFAELCKDLAFDLQNVGLEAFLTSDISTSDARAISLKSSFSKKFEGSTSQDADALGLKVFLESNEICRTFRLEAKRLFHEEVIGEVKHILDDIFFRGPEQLYTWSDFEQDTMVGPGASLGARSYNFYTKLFDSTLTYTDDRLPHYYLRSLRPTSSWAAAEKQRSTEYGFARVVGNRLSFAPKTSKISRPICTEPSLNMFFQLGVGSLFERLLRRHFKIDLSTQQANNRRLARLGSFDGSFGTIDLKSASDTVSLTLLKQILPPYVYRWLEMFRSEQTILPDGSVCELHMVSSMGNGFTFPLQTLLFATIVRACYRVLGIKPKFSDSGPENFGVYGDDIIVERQAYHFVVDCLGLFGFTVNEEKSFNVGAFRESCGGDYYKGADIRGIYVKHLRDEADVYSAINRLVRWCSQSGIPLPTVIRRLSSWCRYLPVPTHAGDTEGLKVPLKYLGRTHRDKDTGCIKYRALVPVPVRFKAPTGDAGGKRYYPGKRKRQIGVNESGLLVAFVGGFIQDGRITLRNEEQRRFKVRTRRTPHWDYYDSAEQCAQVHDWEVMYGMLLDSNSIQAAA